MDGGLREGLRDFTVLSFEVSHALNSEIATHVEPALATNSMVSLLSTLTVEGPRRPQQLAGALEMSPAGVSSLLHRAESAGCVTRTVGEVADDRRSVVVSLTTRGRDLIGLVDRLARATYAAHAPQWKAMRVALDEGVGDARLEPGSVVPAAATPAAFLAALSRVGIALTEAVASTEADGEQFETSATVVLLLIDDVGSCRPGYVVERLGITSGGVSRILDRLESAHLITRSYGSVKTDRRAIVIELTPAGVAHVDRVVERLTPLAALLHGMASDLCDVLGIGDD